MFETVNTASLLEREELVEAPDGDAAKLNSDKFRFHVHLNLCTRIK